MKKACSVFRVFSIFYYSCEQNKTGAIQSPANDTAKFFQVTQYLRSQIAEVNKTPYYIYKLTITNGKKDSSAVDNAVFNVIAAQFLKPDINEADIKKYYKENIFHDQTTKSFTISYSTENKQLEIQNIEVLLQEDGETVKRIFIRKFFTYPDSSVIEQLSWKPDQRFQINRLVQKPNNQETSYQTDVVWNENS